MKRIMLGLLGALFLLTSSVTAQSNTVELAANVESYTWLVNGTGVTSVGTCYAGI